MGILDAIDLEITPEALQKLGFVQRLYLRDIDMRYHLETMSNAEKADMVNENIYYVCHINDYYHIVIRYYPNSFSFNFFYDLISDRNNILVDLLHSNKNMLDDNKLGRRQYNLTITCEGNPHTAIAEQKVMCDNLRDLESWVNIAKLMSKKGNYR